MKARAVIAATAVGLAVAVPLGSVATASVRAGGAGAQTAGGATLAHHGGGIFHHWHDDTTDVRPPGSPTRPTVSVSDTAITVNWDRPRRSGGAPVESYAVLREVRTDSGVTRTTVNVDGRQLVEMLSALPGGRIRYQVAAINGVGAGRFSEWSDTIVVVQAPTPPVAVSGSISAGQVVARWKSPRTSGGAAVSSYLVRVVAVRSKSITQPALHRLARTNAFWKVDGTQRVSTRTVTATHSSLGKARKGYTYAIAIEARNARGKVSHRSSPVFVSVR